MEQFIFTNASGNTLTASYTSNDYILQEYEGLSASEITPITNTGYNQIGNTFVSNKLGARFISITFYVVGSTMADLYEKRKNLARVFNPTLGEGVLKYTNDYISKSITCAVSQPPYPIEKNGNLQLFVLELVAQNPLWYDNAVSALKLGDFTGGLEFPFDFEDDITFASKGDIANITITGDVPSPITAEFRDNSLNPKLTLVNTGEFLEVETELLEDEKLTIYTHYGNKTAIHTDSSGTETSAYHLVSEDSTYFSLAVGENQLSFEGDSGSPEVYLYWRNWFTGV